MTAGAINVRALGRTGLELTELGFGSAPLGGFRGAVNEHDAITTLQHAFAGGIRYFDTAPFYGYGRAELRVGALLRDLPRSSYRISTKVGRVTRPLWGGAPDGHRAGGLPFAAEFNYTYDGTMRSLEQSMLRTGITTFDMALVHDLDTFIHKERAEFEHHYATAINGAMRALQELKAAGVIRAIGIGLNEAPTCARFIRDADLDCVLLAGRYTLLDLTACDEVVPLCKSKGIGLIAGGPFNSGILAGIPGPGSAYHYADAPRDVIAKALRLHELAEVHGTSLHAAALRCALMSSVVSSVIPGARDVREVDAVLASHGSRVPAAFWTAAQQAGLLREDMSIDCAEFETV